MWFDKIVDDKSDEEKEDKGHMNGNFGMHFEIRKEGREKIAYALPSLSSEENPGKAK